MNLRKAAEDEEEGLREGTAFMLENYDYGKRTKESGNWNTDGIGMPGKI